MDMEDFRDKSILILQELLEKVSEETVEEMKASSEWGKAATLTALVMGKMMLHLSGGDDSMALMAGLAVRDDAIGLSQALFFLGSEYERQKRLRQFVVREQ